MRRRRLALWAAALGAVCASASAIRMNELFMRQSSCAPNFDPCRNADFPDYFCCPSSQKCIALAGDTTVLCCPDGSDCQRIRPVPCDISLQDGEKNPDAVIKTTALAGSLARCGAACCPFGYSCSPNDECVMDKDQNAAPIQTSAPKPRPDDNPDTKTSSSADPDPSPTPDGTSPAESPGTTEDPPEEEGGDLPVAAIAGGVTAAVVLLLASAVAAFFFFGKKKKKESRPPHLPKLSRSTSSFGNLISNPIVAENTTLRSDFTGRTPPSLSAPAMGPPFMSPPTEDPDSVTGALIADTMTSPDANGMPAVPPPVVHRPGSQSGDGGYGGYGGLGGEYDQPSYVDMPYANYDNAGFMPQTPRQNREPSSVSINVFADPGITPDRTPESNPDRRYTHMTTFTQMLDRADLGGIARGETYVPHRTQDDDVRDQYLAPNR